MAISEGKHEFAVRCPRCDEAITIVGQVGVVAIVPSDGDPVVRLKVRAGKVAHDCGGPPTLFDGDR